MNRTRLTAVAALAMTLITAAPAAADSPIRPPGEIATPTLPPQPPAIDVIAAGDRPTIEVIHVETDTNFGDIGSQGTVLFAETLAGTGSADPGWWMRLDVRIRNTGDQPVEVTALGIVTDASPLSIEPVEPVVVEPGATATFKPHDLTGAGTPPTVFTVNVYDATAPFPAQATYDAQVHANPTPTGGYRFPARAEDLAPGTFWTIGGFHLHSASQRYAYDFGVVRWDDDHGWTGFSEQAYVDDANGIPLGSRDAHYLVFGQPVYSMSDGTIVKCRRSIEDQEPPLGDVTASNSIGIMHDNGEYAAYAHLQRDSIPPQLCPVETPGGGVAPGHVPVKVRAGQFLGSAGSSGDETPHLHVQVSDGGPETPSWRIRGLPINFHDVFVHTRDGYDPTTGPGDWNWVTWPEAAALSPRQLVHPNSCGWDVEPAEIDDLTLGSRPGSPGLPPVAECDQVPDPLVDDPQVAIPGIGGGLKIGPRDDDQAVVPSDPEYTYVPVRRAV